MIHSITMQVLHTNLTKPTKHFLGGKTKRQFARPRNRTKYSYDANGNMTNRAGDAITWYSYDKPNRIDYGSDYAEFKYGPDRSRFKQVTKLGSNTTTTYYVGGHFEKETSGSAIVYRHNIAANGQTVATYTRPTLGSATTKYVHRDHLGSIVALTDETGAVDQTYSFDAFGKRRNSDWSADTSDLRYSDSHLTERGFTGHEQLDNVRLTHMNGRVNDPITGRMISADPMIPDAFDSQAYNRYSYVGNSPLSLVDPSGFDWEPPCIKLIVYETSNCPSGGGWVWESSNESDGDEINRRPLGESTKGLRHCKRGGCANLGNLNWWIELPDWIAYFDTFERDLETMDQYEAQADCKRSGRECQFSQTSDSQLMVDLLGHATTASGLLVGVQNQAASRARNLAAFRFTTMHKAGAFWSEMSPYRFSYNDSVSSSKTWSNLFKGTKFLSQGFFFATVGANLWQGGNAVIDRDWGGVAIATADISFGYYAATGGVPGLVAGATWTVSYNGTSAIVEIPSVRSVVVTPIADFACRLSGEC